jgi:hypothetical protein
MEQLEKIKKFLQTDFAKQSLESLSVIAQMYGEDEISQTLYYYEGNEFPELYYDPNIGGRNGFKELKSGLLRQFLESLYELIQEDILDLFEDELDKYDSFHSSSFYVDLNFETKKLDLSCSVTVMDTEYSNHEFEITDTNVIESMRELFDNGHNKIRVDFSGGGDSGYIESTGNTSDDTQIDIPATIEDELYRVLENVQSGWEINEGSQGNFLIDCAATKIYLEFGLNYEKGERVEDEFSIDLQY